MSEAATHLADPSDPADTSAPAASEPPRYTIDELTAVTGIPSRTIRFYQSAGALQPPHKIGRVGFYGPEHVERLELIGRLQDRGLRMRAIKDLVDRIAKDELVLDEWLGLGEQLSSSWSDDEPQLLGLEQLRALGLPAEPRPGMIAALVREGLLEARGEDRYLVPSPALLRVALELDRAGVSLEVASGANKIMQRHLAKAAGELAGYFAEHAGDGFGDDLPSIAEAFRVLKPLGLESVKLIFAREIEQVLRRMVESGEAAKIDKKRRKKSR